ncbi:hypothetical protein GQX74_012134 [Glossina fuscipes]|nr:hypothetical protein GQX74_012134 [Glossina fuscipes]
MFSILINLWKNTVERRRLELIAKYEQEEAYLDAEIAREDIEIERLSRRPFMRGVIRDLPSSLRFSDGQENFHRFGRTEIHMYIVIIIK